MTKINYITKIEITIIHENETDTDGLDNVLMNIVRKWDLSVTPSIYQAKPSPVDDALKNLSRSS